MSKQRFYHQAIETKYIAPGNVRGSRIKATAEAGSVTLHWAHNLDAQENHRRAAEALRDKVGWEGELIGGSLKKSYVWIFAEIK